MTLLWPIFFSALSALGTASISGRVELTGTKVQDRSGVVLWLEPVQTDAPRPVAPHVSILQKDKTFQPHVLAVPVGTVVDFPNLDPIFHNAFSSFDGKIFDVGLYPPGSSRSVRFDRPGIVRVFCNIHPLMSAVIVVVNSPWFAVSSRDGSFEFPGVPAGDYMLHLYHERATSQTLAALTSPISIHDQRLEIPPIAISETGYLPAPHKNKFGKDYPNQSSYPGRTQ
jgi:plastocyanin